MDGKKLFEQHMRQRTEVAKGIKAKQNALMVEFEARKDTLIEELAKRKKLIEDEDETLTKEFCLRADMELGSLPEPERETYMDLVRAKMLDRILETIVVHVINMHDEPAHNEPKH